MLTLSSGIHLTNDLKKQKQQQQQQKTKVIHSFQNGTPSHY